MFPNGTDYYLQSEVDYRRELLRASWGHRSGRRPTRPAPHRRTIRLARDRQTAEAHRRAA